MTNCYQNKIWWLASYPKSGSTWIRFFINCAITRFPVDINANFQYITGDISANMYQSVTCVPLGLMGTREVVYLRPAALINMLAFTPNRDICLKTHHANKTIDDIPLCPERISRGAVYVVRDPRDIAVSFSRHTGMSIDETITSMSDEAANIKHQDLPISHYLSSWSSHVKSWTNKQTNPITTGCVKYEDLLSFPQKTFWAIIACLGLQDRITQQDFDFAMEQTRFQNLKRLEQKGGFKEASPNQSSFFNTGTSGGWRNKLTFSQSNRIVDDHGEMMKVLGYL